MATEVAEIAILHLGLLDYEKSWEIQRQIHQEVVDGKRANTLILVEHPSVYTAGRRTQTHERPLDGTPVIDVDRGGRITWHGPGQIIGYPIIQLEKRNEVVGFVRTIENALINTISDFQLQGISIADKTGVWIRDLTERKIAAIGIRVAKGVSMHGFALNVNPELSAFSKIIACGMPDAQTTSMERELKRNITVTEVLPSLEAHMIKALALVSTNARVN